MRVRINETGHQHQAAEIEHGGAGCRYRAVRDLADVLALDEHGHAVFQLARLGIEQPAILEQDEHGSGLLRLRRASLPCGDGAAQGSDIGTLSDRYCLVKKGTMLCGTVREESMSSELKEGVVDRNPRMTEEARAFVKHVESLFMPWNVEGIVAGFTDDCVVRFGDVPEFRGKAELTRLFRARSARQRGYRLRKELRAMMGDMLANYWEGDWEDAQTGAKMMGRGVEVWQLRGGKIALWEAAFNVHEAGKDGGGSGIL